MIKAFILNCDAEVSTCIYAAKKNEKRITKGSMLLPSLDGWMDRWMCV